MNNDFGKAYDAGFRAWLAQSPARDRIEYVSETIEPQTPTIGNPMTTLRFEEPDVFIAMVAGTPCTQAITEAAENGMKQEVKYLFQPSVCKSSSFGGRDKVGGDGRVSDGWWIIGGGVKDLNSPAHDDDPYVVWARDLLTSHGLDYRASGSFGSGLIFGWAMAQAVQIAGQLDGGLTRSNLMLAVRTMDMTHPMTLPGITFSMDGNADAYLIEGSDVARFDAASQSWQAQGPIVQLNGASGTCTWDPAAARCG
jgi:ABC-type branched-subunit amino acid transport system substrate-binding protein